jgi:hypothetical protein
MEGKIFESSWCSHAHLSPAATLVKSSSFLEEDEFSKKCRYSFPLVDQQT